MVEFIDELHFWMEFAHLMVRMTVLKIAINHKFMLYSVVDVLAAIFPNTGLVSMSWRFSLFFFVCLRIFGG